ncbi:MAG: hypothetical protein ACI4S0_02545 [Dorea sp.]
MKTTGYFWERMIICVSAAEFITLTGTKHYYVKVILVTLQGNICKVNKNSLTGYQQKNQWK